MPPFITSTLQQESSRKLRFSVKRTMMLAQRLYEGVETRQGRRGRPDHLHAYRFDARLRRRASTKCAHYIGERYGAEYLPGHAERLQAQEGRAGRARSHPSDLAWRTPGSGGEVPGRRRDEAVPADLECASWRRQMMPAVFDQTTIDVTAKGKDGVEYMFRATGVGAEVRRLPEGLRGRQGPEGRRRRGAEAQAAGRDAGRGAEAQGARARAALHRAAAALQRSDAGEGAGSRRRRPAVHVRVDSLHHSGARVREEGRRPVHPHRARAWW